MPLRREFESEARKKEIAAKHVTLIPIQVECYAGAKADETPRRFTWEGQTIEVDEVVDRWC